MAGPTLKCATCQRVLVHVPIYQSENSRLICGKCIPQNQLECVRVSPFEFFAMNQEFPCRYQISGCTSKLKPEDMEEHVKNCRFRRTQSCPTSKFTKCAWRGHPTTLLHHCQADHHDLILKSNMFMLGMNNEQHQEFLRISIFEHQVFVATFRLKLAERKITVAMVACSNGELDELECKMVFDHALSSLEIELPISANINQFREMDVNLNSLNCAKCELVLVKIEIIDKRNPVSNFIPSKHVLERLRCPVCQCLMRTPMFLYLGGPTVCDFCHENIQQFSTSPNNIHNYALEDFAKAFKYWCKFPGCEYLAQDIEEHEKTCQKAIDFKNWHEVIPKLLIKGILLPNFLSSSTP